MDITEDKLWLHQKNCIAQANEAVKEGKNAVISLPPGAGKSRIMLEVVNEFIALKKDARVLIAANRRILLDSVWRAEIHKWAPDLGDKVTTVDGRREPATREAFWSHAKEYNYVVIATPHIIMKDISAGVLDINNFDLIVLDEVHHSVKFNGVKYTRSRNYQFLDDFSNSVVGITIRSNVGVPKKVTATTELLNAILITDSGAKERDLEKIVIELSNDKRESAESFLNKEIGRLVVIFKSRYPHFSGFPFGDIERTKKACNISSDLELRKFKTLASQYYILKTVKGYLDEDDSEYVLTSLLSSIKSETVNRNLKPLLEDWKKIKLKTAVETAKKEIDEQKPVIIFVKYRATAYILYELLRQQGVPVGLLIGGIYDSASEKLKEFMRKKIKCLVATQDMGGEGLNLQYFRTIVLCGGIQNEFKRLNIEGRIRGGKLIQLLYKNTEEQKGIVSSSNVDTQNIKLGALQQLWALLLLLFYWVKNLIIKFLNFISSSTMPRNDEI